MAAIDLRYAHALAAVAAEKKIDPAQIQGELADFIATFEGSPELREVLENPSIAEAQKLKLLDTMAPKLGLSGTVRNFLAVIVHHERLHELAGMAADYARIADEESQVADAEVVSAHKLDEGSRKLLEDKIAKLAGSGGSRVTKVRATYTEDAALLGGAVITIGSTVYDGSVRAQLQQMKDRMMTAGA
jgi:F-type H+-transporting ATPase subunit delta